MCYVFFGKDIPRDIEKLSDHLRIRPFLHKNPDSLLLLELGKSCRIGQQSAGLGIGCSLQMEWARTRQLGAVPALHSDK